MAPPDWTAPESLAKRIHQRSLCPPAPAHSALQDEEGSILTAAPPFVFRHSLLVLNPRLHLSSPPSNYLPSVNVLLLSLTLVPPPILSL